MINYLIIFILTLISIIGLLNINKVEQKLKLKGTKIVLFFIILMTYMTLVSYPVKKILNNHIVNIDLPIGEKGPRGDRGKGGSPAICDTCGDDLCLKKILFNITNTYNYWRQLNGLKTYSDTYVIKNEYIKDKIIKHCKSPEFQKIIQKYGSNNQNCPENLQEYGCGAYDYMFKMWSIWILIILKYKNGSFFLESDSLTDVDFDGLIEAEDCFIHGDIVIYKDEKFVIDKSKESKMIHPMYHIEQLTNPRNKKIVHISQLVLCTEFTEPERLDIGGIDDNSKNQNRHWKQMFTKSDNGSNDDDRGLKIKRIKKKINFDDTISTTQSLNKDTIVFTASGVNEEFFKTEGLPHRGKLSPFDEIKKYDAWYWGRDEKLKPELIVSKPFVSDFKKTCPSGKIKFIKTNKYIDLFTSKYKKYNRNSLNSSLIQDIMGSYSNDITFLRAEKITVPNEHGYFKEYKPIGDILITENEKIQENSPEQTLNCKPNYPIFSNDEKDVSGYTNIIGKKITNKETYLVSGDTKSPVDFELIWKYKKSQGINRGFIGLSIWKPIPPAGYRALGYVVDNRYSETDSNTAKPSLDSIACVPNIFTEYNNSRFNGSSNINWEPVNSNFFTKLSIGPSQNDISSTKRFFRNKHTNTFVCRTKLLSEPELDIKINEDSAIVCTKGEVIVNCDGTTKKTCNSKNCIWNSKDQTCSFRKPPSKNPRTSIKDKKFSILRLYD